QPAKQPGRGRQIRPSSLPEVMALRLRAANRLRIGSLSMLGRVILAVVATLALAETAFAQDADHPKDKTLVVGSDFGVAPWMVRGAAGPQGIGAGDIYDIANGLRRARA